MATTTKERRKVSETTAKGRVKPKKTEAIPATLESFISNLPEIYLFCRTDRHNWNWTGDDGITVNTRGEVIEFTRHSTCSRCLSDHRVTFSVPDFRRSKKHTDYSDGYLAAKGLGRIPLSAVFMEQLSRAGLKIPKR